MTEVSQDPKKSVRKSMSEQASVYAQKVRNSFNSFKDNTAARVAKKDVNKTAKSTAKSIEKNTAKRTTRKPSGKKRKKKIKFKRNKVLAVCRVLIILFVTLAIIGGIAGAGYAAYVISKADTIHPDKIYETLDVSSHIFDQDGELVDEIYFSENRHLVKYEDLPENLKNAFIAIEDKTFWKHKGFNFKRIFGAILEKFRGGTISGTSTITQQLARNVFLPDDKSSRTIKRKITEMYYAYEIEQELSKEEIITAYLNTIYLGYGCYGVDTAARTYFGVTIDKLSLEQCAALAALPQAPHLYALLTSEEEEGTKKIKNGLYSNDVSKDRRDLVLALMEAQGYITAEEREAATKPLEDFIKPGKESVTENSAFKDYLIETVKQDLMDKYELTEEQAFKMLYTKGLSIYSTLAPKTQGIITREFAKDENFPDAGKGKVQAAMVITEVGTGEIKAMVGSRKPKGEMLFNRATNPRQPGSSLKPLSVYSAALQRSFEYCKNGEKFKFTDFGYDKQGVIGWGDYITAASIIADQKMVVDGRQWPYNFTRGYSGINTFRTALQQSINTCAVKIVSQVGVPYSAEIVKKYGITTLVDDSEAASNDLNYAALALGAMTRGVTPLEMSLAYGAFPNKGVRNTPICYRKVEDSEGNILLETKVEKVKVLDEGVAWIMMDVLQSSVSQGLASNARIKGIEAGGKTGTTNDNYDFWFAGFTPEMSSAIWIGTDDNVWMNGGSYLAAKLWGKIMNQIGRSTRGKYPSMPDNVIKKDGEYFTKGTEPTKKIEDKSGIDEDGHYIPSLLDLINGWTDEDQRKADEKIREEREKKEKEERENRDRDNKPSFPWHN